MAENQSKFDIWWSAPGTKRIVGAVYSLGAAIVIIGAMFKILHLPGAAIMLGAGMTIEAVLFSLGIFDKPHEEYKWENVYDFEGGGMVNGGNASVVSEAHNESNVVLGENKIANNAAITSITPSRAVGLNFTETINDDDVKKLSEGIKNLTTTAEQLAAMSTMIGSTDKFIKSVDGAIEATDKYASTQNQLSDSTNQLSRSYQGIAESMNSVEKSTKSYAGKIDDINKNLSSVNSIYEIQLKNIQAQSEGLTLQTERVRKVNDELAEIVTDVVKMKAATSIVAHETESLKSNTTKLSSQIVDLNLVYGNMLNSLS